MRGQAAVEWIVVMSVGILVLAIMLSLNEDSFQLFRGSVRVSQTKAALNDLKNAVDFVYSQGTGARTRLYVTVPPSVNVTFGTLPGGSGQIQAVVYVGGKSEYFDVYTDAAIVGSLPNAAGGYCVDVEYQGDAVNISRSGGSC
jgi:hypothetical protein